ncbi:hypothetical protein Pint_03471 [Pistacia integerrima]|uniref:Uncharacterized protein n=1 Tax=Pistacia integerrima TaxID=434235 RepID=A0ACC0ZN82_9ROSI|nr:hypothetical protein Pint_03471 [Pistacia integerrima]
MYSITYSLHCASGNDITRALQFDFGAIKVATNNFSTDNKLGEGGFGEVYKAWKHWRDGTPLQLLDSTLSNSYSRDEVIRCVHVGLLCVQEDPTERPTMATIDLMLNSYSVTLPSPQQPAFYLGTRREVTMPPNKPCSVYEESITELYPR